MATLGLNKLSNNSSYSLADLWNKNVDIINQYLGDFYDKVNFRPNGTIYYVSPSYLVKDYADSDLVPWKVVKDWVESRNPQDWTSKLASLYAFNELQNKLNDKIREELLFTTPPPSTQEIIGVDYTDGKYSGKSFDISSYTDLVKITPDFVWTEAGSSNFNPVNFQNKDKSQFVFSNIVGTNGDILLDNEEWFYKVINDNSVRTLIVFNETYDILRQMKITGATYKNDGPFLKESLTDLITKTTDGLALGITANSNNITTNTQDIANHYGELQKAQQDIIKNTQNITTNSTQIQKAQIDIKNNEENVSSVIKTITETIIRAKTDYTNGVPITKIDNKHFQINIPASQVLKDLKDNQKGLYLLENNDINLAPHLDWDFAVGSTTSRRFDYRDKNKDEYVIITKEITQDTSKNIIIDLKTTDNDGLPAILLKYRLIEMEYTQTTNPLPPSTSIYYDYVKVFDENDFTYDTNEWKLNDVMPANPANYRLKIITNEKNLITLYFSNFILSNVANINYVIFGGNQVLSAKIEGYAPNGISVISINNNGTPIDSSKAIIEIERWEEVDGTTPKKTAKKVNVGDDEIDFIYPAGSKYITIRGKITMTSTKKDFQEHISLAKFEPSTKDLNDGDLIDISQAPKVNTLKLKTKNNVKIKSNTLEGYL